MKAARLICAGMLACAFSSAASAASNLACLNKDPIPATAKLVYNSFQSGKVAIQEVVPNCARINYGGYPTWIVTNPARGIWCEGDTLALRDERSIRRRNMPAVCGPAQPVPTTPPVITGSPAKIWYDNESDLADYFLVGVSDKCYKVDGAGSGNYIWFPKSAAAYHPEYYGNPVALDYNKRQFTPC